MIDRLRTAGLLWVLLAANADAAPFQIEEATITDIQTAIQRGRVTCQDVVRAYLDRAAAYNGVCTRLLTEKGDSIAQATGAVRAGEALKFPVQTQPVTELLAGYADYRGLPLDFGYMATTASDPKVQQQYGMVVGWPKAGQLNALETLNIRGERSVSCKAECDLAPNNGKLAAHCPAACEAFRQQPDAMERAAQLDADYGRKPDLKKLPLYCTTASVKDWYDVKDMRSTGGNDVDFAMDAPPQDATVVAALREAGAIVMAVSIAAEVGMRGETPEQASKVFVGGSGSIRSSWGGHVCNPYATERSAGPSSGGAGASVSANLVTFAICETTGGSCREPASQNAVTSVVTTKGLLSEYGTATAQYAHHRPGILARKLEDAVLVLDAIQRPRAGNGFYDSNDVFTAQPQALLSAQPYRSALVSTKQKGKPLQGLRIGIVREYMVKHTPNDAAISDRVDAEFKKVLRDQLGATLVESTDPDYPDDPDIANMSYSFQRALGETLAVAAPEYLLQKLGDDYEFAVPGEDISQRDYRVRLALGSAPLSAELNLRRILSGLDDGDLDSFSLDRYLTARGDARVASIADYAQHSQWRAQAQAVAMRNAAKGSESTRTVSGMDRIKMREVFRLAILKVMYENQIDVFVHPNLTVPQWKIGVDREPTVAGRRAAGPSITDLLGVPEVIVPAGFDDRVFEPQYALSADKTRYTLVTGKEATTLRVPMPFSINFWAGPGDEATVLKAAFAYEARTRHRVPPPEFGPLKN